MKRRRLEEDDLEEEEVALSRSVRRRLSPDSNTGGQGLGKILVPDTPPPQQIVQQRQASGSVSQGSSILVAPGADCVLDDFLEDSLYSSQSLSKHGPSSSHSEYLPSQISCRSGGSSTTSCSIPSLRRRAEDLMSPSVVGCSVSERSSQSGWISSLRVSEEKNESGSESWCSITSPPSVGRSATPAFSSQKTSSSSSSSSRSVPLEMQRQETLEREKEVKKLEGSVLYVLESLKGSCLLCLLKEDNLHRDHVSVRCKMEERRSFLGAAKYMHVPEDRGREFLCYGCFLPTERYKGWAHGSAGKQESCEFAHIFRPMIWGCWHFERVRADFVEFFKPRGRSGKALTEEGQWDEFFKWCFKKDSAIEGLMNYLFVIVWMAKRSTSFKSIYGRKKK